MNTGDYWITLSPLRYVLYMQVHVLTGKRKVGQAERVGRRLETHMDSLPGIDRCLTNHYWVE